MPIVDHNVSCRNGSQIMVAGINPSLRTMGYGPGAHISVTDPAGNPAHAPWVFVVANNEHATLVCRNPAPPVWIQPGVRVRISVQPPAPAGTAESDLGGETIPPTVNVAVALDQPRTPTEIATAPEQRRPELPVHVVYAVDVGSPTGGLAWARVAPHSGQPICGSTDYDLFLNLLISDLRAKMPVALGFEGPMFLPVARVIGDLTRARQGEPSAWSYGAGAYTSAIAIPLMAHTLNSIYAALDPRPYVSLDAGQWLAQGAPRPDLLLWEAFVYGPGHARGPNPAGLVTHIQDAATAVNAFVEWESAAPRQPSAVTAYNPISTAGAAVLWSGLGKDLALLHQEVLVLLPVHPTGAGVIACSQ